MDEYMQVFVATFCFVLFMVCFQFHLRKSVLTNWPILGMYPYLHANASRFHDFLAETMSKTGGTFQFKGPWFAKMDYLFTCDPRNVQYILTENFGNFPKGSEFKQTVHPLGDGFFAVDGDLWKLQRKLIHSSIRNEHVGQFVRNHIKAKLVDELIPLLKLASTERIEIDLQQVFQKFTFDNACLLILGMDPSSLSGNSDLAGELKKAFDKSELTLFSRFLTLWKWKRWLRVGTEKELDEVVKTLDPFLYDCISSQIERFKQSRLQGEKPLFTLLTSFLDKNEDEEAKFSIKFLRDVAVSLSFAGKDTLSATMTWFFWLVSTNPSVESKILQEIRENLEADDNADKELGVFEPNKLNRLVYLHAAVCETLRLYPPVSLSFKNGVLPVTFPSGHAIQKNARIVLLFYAMGRMENIWGLDCREFKPERWISEKGKILHVSSSKFTAFNSGPRTCLGKDLSFTQIKMVAASLLWNFHVEVVENHPVVPCSSLVLNMQYGLKVKIFKRVT